MMMLEVDSDEITQILCDFAGKRLGQSFNSVNLYYKLDENGRQILDKADIEFRTMGGVQK